MFFTCYILTRFIVICQRLFLTFLRGFFPLSLETLIYYHLDYILSTTFFKKNYFFHIGNRCIFLFFSIPYFLTLSRERDLFLLYNSKIYFAFFVEIETALYSRNSYSFHFLLIFQTFLRSTNSKKFLNKDFNVFHAQKKSHYTRYTHKKSPVRFTPYTHKKSPICIYSRKLSYII